MLPKSEIIALVHRSIGAVSDLTIAPLAGDASNRSYYRLSLSPGSHPPSLILMQLAEPEAFKKAEEAVSASTIPITELPFLNIQRHLEAAGVAVPHVYGYDQRAGRLLLEDVGDVTMEAWLAGAEAQSRRDIYKEAIDELIGIQTRAAERKNGRCIAFGRAFDVPLLLWELDHFLEYGIEARGGPVPARDREAIRAEFLRIAQFLASLPRTFTHRDYHSRNLMVHAKKIRILDFQDALLGPPTYDLASLLRDSYVELEPQLVEELIRYYRDRLRAAGKGDPGEADDFDRAFRWTALQRNLKAAGRFVYIHRVKGKDLYLQSIPRTLGYVQRTLSTDPDLARLGELLRRYVPELTS